MSNNKSDNELRAYALNAWANYIETNTMVLSARDAYNQGKIFNILGTKQMSLVVRLRKLANDEMKKEN